MSASTWAITCGKMDHSDQRGLECFKYQALVHSLFIREHFLHRWNALLDNAVDFFLNIGCWLFDTLNFAFILNIWIVLKMVSFRGLPLVFCVLKKEIYLTFGLPDR